MPGVPALVTNATRFPSAISPMIRSPARSSLCSWKAICGFWISKCFSSSPVLRVSSLATMSTSRSVVSARSEMSSRLPIGVATRYSTGTGLTID
jgi:hypothetical protein